MGGAANAKQYDAYYKAIEECCDYAVEKKVALVIKPHGGLNSTGEQCRKTIEKVAKKNFRLWYDPGNIFFYSATRSRSERVRNSSPSIARVIVRRTSRTSGWRGASQIRATSFAQIANRLVREGIEPAVSYILFELFVPGRSVERKEPIPESAQFSSGQFFDRSLNLGNTPHRQDDTFDTVTGKIE